MAKASDAHTPKSDTELLITRVFNAPREMVWNAWTDPAHIAQWWGPGGFNTRVVEMNLRPGGRWRYVMVGPDGTEYPVTGVFREVVPHERLVTSDDFDEGFAHANVNDLPHGIVLTVLFEDIAGKTRVTLRIAHPTLADRRKHEEMGVVAGWNSSLDRLQEYVTTLR